LFLWTYKNEKKMSTAKRGGDAPIACELEEGKKYAWCSCGQSCNQPYCDGSHKGSGFVPLMFTAEKTGTKYLCACKATGNGPFCDGSHK
jgi:CDGSH-type Zn-finger protein